MWKRLKLLTLLLVTVLLAWATFIAMRPLVDSRSGVRWGERDRVDLIVADADDLMGDLDIDAEIESGQDSGGSDEFPTDRIWAYVTHPPQAPNQLRADQIEGYLVASGQARYWLGRCFSGEPGKTAGSAKQLALTSLPGRVARNVAFPAESVIYQVGPSITCATSGDSWGSSGSAHKFATPPIAIIAFSPGGKMSPFINDNDTERGPFCARTTLTYGPGITVDYQFPVSKNEVNVPNTGRRKLAWVDCSTVKHRPGFDDQSTSQDGVNARLTDNAQADSISRSLFYAGALVGVLGGLVIEIIGSCFEIAESAAKKRQGKLSWPDWQRRFRAMLGRRRRNRKGDPGQLTLWD